MHPPADIFSGLANLQVLDLSYNELGTLPDTLFSGLTTLQWLYLGHNQLGALTDGVFSGLTILQVLELDYNQLTSLPDNVFSGVQNLEALDLTGNQLIILGGSSFSSLTNLHTLELDNNALASLTDGLFSGLTNLQTLNLNLNQLTTLPEDILSDLTNLESLRLNSNQLNNFDLEWFSGLTNLQFLYLSGNCLELDKVPVKGLLASLKLGIPTVYDSPNPRVDIVCPAIPATISTFDSSAEGWTVFGEAVDWDNSGYITTGAVGSNSFWLSPEIYSGDAEDYYGRTLRFDLRKSGTGNSSSKVHDVLLIATYMKLNYDLPSDPGTDWTSYEIALSVASNWLKDDGSAATEQEIRDVLADLVYVQIRWRYLSGPDAAGDLDNVVFGDE